MRGETEFFVFSITPLTREPSQGSHAPPACAGRGRRLGMAPQTQGSAGAPPWATNISPLAGLGQTLSHSDSWLLSP